MKLSDLLQFDNIIVQCHDNPASVYKSGTFSIHPQIFIDSKAACQCIYRDARITSIYEGTTQLQTVAAIRYVTNGSYIATLRNYEAIPCSEEMQPLMDRVKEMANKFDACTNAVKEAQNQELLDFVARRLYEMAAVCIMSHLLIQDATKAPELFAKSAHVYVNYAEAEIEKHFNFIRKIKADDLADYRL